MNIFYRVIRMFGGWAGTFPSWEAAEAYRKEHCPSGKTVPIVEIIPGRPLY